MLCFRLHLTFLILLVDWLIPCQFTAPGQYMAFDSSLSYPDVLPSVRTCRTLPGLDQPACVHLRWCHVCSAGPSDDHGVLPVHVDHWTDLTGTLALSSHHAGENTNSFHVALALALTQNMGLVSWGGSSPRSFLSFRLLGNPPTAIEFATGSGAVSTHTSAFSATTVVQPVCSFLSQSLV